MEQNRTKYVTIIQEKSDDVLWYFIYYSSTYPVLSHLKSLYC